jgi:hypothetical protein
MLIRDIPKIHQPAPIRIVTTSHSTSSQLRSGLVDTSSVRAVTGSPATTHR